MPQWHDHHRYCSFNVAYSVVAIFFLAVTTAFTADHIHRQISEARSPTLKRRIFCRDLSFYVFVIVVLALHIAIINDICFRGVFVPEFKSIFTACYGFQGTAMMAIWVDRTYSNFNGSPTFRMSKRTIAGFVAVILVDIASVFVVSVFGAFDVRMTTTLFAMAVFLSSVVIMAMFCGLFLSKMCRVHKIGRSQNARNVEMVHTVTRLFVLNFWSLMVTVITALSLPLTTYNGLEFICYFLALFDVFSNFVCIAMTYQHNARYYRFLCRLCDGCCVSLGHKIAGSDEMNLALGMRRSGSLSARSPEPPLETAGGSSPDLPSSPPMLSAHTQSEETTDTAATAAAAKTAELTTNVGHIAL